MIDDTEITIEIGKAIVHGDTTITKFSVREPTAGQIEQWDSLSGASADIKAVSIVAGLPETVVKQIPARAFYTAARHIGGFLSTGPSIGVSV